jgi:hypothetical protein
MDFSLKDRTITLCGKRGSGKSQLLHYIVSLYKDDFKKILCVCPSEGVNNFYEGFIPDDCIFKKYEEKWGNQLMDKMEKINKDRKKNGKDLDRVLLIMDDVCSDVRVASSDSIKRIFTRGRHCGIAIIITAQFIMHLPPVCRINSDYFCVSQLNRQGLEVLTTEFLMGNIDKKEFMKMYYKCTSNYGFLLISNNSASDNNNLDEIYGMIKTPKEFIK